MSALSTTGTEMSSGSFRSQVGFRDVEVRHYERCLSDNPSVQDGPPIGIGWEVHGEQKFSVDEFEGSRELARQPDINLLMLPKTHRQELLMSAGYSQKEIAQSVRGVIKAKNQRRQTVNNLDKIPLEEFMENTKRSMKGVFCFGKSKENKIFMSEAQKLHVTNAAA
mmetsp:Transcript_32802/g.79467  ORF Transcript_32802/g.79467 Transcript_32802/m.79467 type:complete len:166 (-) Transcript_32802:232-729(-)|eukprot:CAMPEP_0113630490 /NCGR_PEP_ID=MMETSP0017_2-20120614/15843_1 /TAXON_ID=2856 /ORGANISM="Cylindrotheca closterium" /LENGTH=165 /DNA_ID=CAMNT_0000540959 /DNA_START=139 /DNA_END=636 /DNA_ORIENTATION=+ /assembly_acc=CAM_ASM_000147